MSSSEVPGIGLAALPRIGFKMRLTAETGETRHLAQILPVFLQQLMAQPHRHQYTKQRRRHPLFFFASSLANIFASFFSIFSRAFAFAG